ncbi:MAG: M48 family metalloprotease [Acidobacteriota bacterium]
MINLTCCKRIRLFSKYLLVGFLLCGFPLQAFSQEGAEKKERPKGNATIQVDVKKNGNYQIHFSVWVFDAITEEQKQAIQDATGVQLKEGNRPYFDDEDYTDEELEALDEAGLEESENGQPPTDDSKKGKIYYLSGSAKRAFSQEGYLIKGELEFSALQKVLAGMGIQNLSVGVTHPETDYTDCTRDEYREHPLLVPDGQHYYLLSTAGDDVPMKTISIAFGYPTIWIVKRCLALGLLFFLPILFVIWKRRAILRSGCEAMAARYAAFHIINALSFTYPFVWWIGGSLIGFRALWAFFASRSAPVNMVWYFMLYLLPPTTCILICKAALNRFLETEEASPNKEGKLKKFIRESLAMTFGTLLPLVLLFAGIGEIVAGNWKTAIAYFAIGHFFKIATKPLQGKGDSPEAHSLIVAPLRDRIYEIAMRAGVNLKEVYVVPEQKNKTANACATINNTVFLNEFLLKRLSKREVDAVVGHEIGHLRLHHPRILTIIWLATILIPMFLLPILITAVTSFAVTSPQLYLAIYSIQRSDLAVPICMAIGSLLVLMVSRRMEYSADAFAATVTGDPEAMITGLVKLSRLSLLPMNWSKADENLLTHPSSMQRINALAKNYMISQERVDALLNVPDEADEMYSMTATVASSNQALTADAKSASPVQQFVKPSGATKKKPLPVFNLPLQKAFIGLVGGYIVAAFFLHKQLMQYHIPKPLFAMATGVVVFLWSCYSFKQKLGKGSPTHIKIIQTQAADFPGLDLAEYERYTAELTALGFEFCQDYSTENDVEMTLKGVGRLFIHPTERCYAEVVQCASQGLSVTPVYCSISSLVGTDWTMTTSNMEPNGVICARRMPRRIGECKPDSGVEELFDAHINFREEAVAYLGNGVVFENSMESYFQSVIQRHHESRAFIARRNPVAYLYDIHRYDRRPIFKWMGELSSNVYRERKLPQPIYKKA